MSRSKKIRQYLFISLYSILLGLILAEATVRLLGLSKTWTTKNEVQRHEALVKEFFDDAERGHRYVPEAEFISILNQPYSINKDGFRDDNFVNDPNKTVIAFLGASIIEGLGVAVDKRATNVAQDLLQENGFDYVQIYNFGIGGSSTYDELHILQNHVLRYSPEYAVLQIGFNDLFSNWNRTHSQHINITKQDNESWFSPLKTFVQNHSALYLYLAEAYNLRLLKNNSINPVLARVLEDHTEQWSLLFQLIDEFVSTCKEHEVKPVVMYVPFEVEVIVQSDSIAAGRNALIQQFCTESRILFIDLLGSLRDSPEREKLYFDFSHLSESGNEIVGTSIADYFNRLEVLPPITSALLTDADNVEWLAYVYQNFQPLPKSPWSPSKDSLNMAENILKKFVLEDEQADRLWPLRYYARQYVGYINEDGEKVVFIQCFPKVKVDRYKNWKTDLISVMDGGNAYFEIHVNLDKQECFWLSVHGVA